MPHFFRSVDARRTWAAAAIWFALATTPRAQGPAPLNDPDPMGQPPAGPPPTPAHTGIRAMLKELGADVKKLPSRENLMWVGIGSGLALAVHPVDDNVNEALVTSRTAGRAFKPGAILGQSYTLMAVASTVYAIGRGKDQPIPLRSRRRSSGTSDGGSQFPATSWPRTSRRRDCLQTVIG